MELPDDVLEMVRNYAKPSEPFKLYKRILRVLHDLRVEEVSKLKKALRFHYDQFRPMFLRLEPMFLELERTHSELKIAVDAVMRNDTTLYTVSELRMEYYRKRQHYTLRRCEVMPYVITICSNT